jgi:hypothetical protein
MASRRNYQHESNKAESPLRILPVCGDLVDYTLDLTDNTKHFPKKTRFTITNRIQNHVLDIYECLDDANDIWPIIDDQDKIDRIKLQKKALTHCRRLLFFISLSKRRGYIDQGTFDYWTKKTLDVKAMTAKWHKTELGHPDTQADGPSEPDGQEAQGDAQAADADANS